MSNNLIQAMFNGIKKNIDGQVIFIEKVLQPQNSKYRYRAKQLPMQVKTNSVLFHYPLLLLSDMMSYSTNKLSWGDYGGYSLSW